jgi:hypothetical protein
MSLQTLDLTHLAGLLVRATRLWFLRFGGKDTTPEDSARAANNNGIATQREFENSEKNRVNGTLTSKPEIRKKSFSLMSGLYSGIVAFCSVLIPKVLL